MLIGAFPVGLRARLGAGHATGLGARPAAGARLGRDHRGRRLVGLVALVVDALDRGRERLAERQVALRCCAGAQLVEQLEDARAAFGRVVEVDVQVRDALDPQGAAQLVANERHGPLQGHDGPLAFLRLADDADPDLGVAQVRCRLDLRDRHEADARIGDIARDDGADLLPQQLVDSVRSLGQGPT